jgi:hypothetical protein
MFIRNVGVSSKLPRHISKVCTVERFAQFFRSLK